jgi:hypothetical protein
MDPAYTEIVSSLGERQTIDGDEAVPHRRRGLSVRQNSHMVRQSMVLICVPVHGR